MSARLHLELKTRELENYCRQNFAKSTQSSIRLKTLELEAATTVLAAHRSVTFHSPQGAWQGPLLEFLGRWILSMLEKLHTICLRVDLPTAMQ